MQLTLPWDAVSKGLGLGRFSGISSIRGKRGQVMILREHDSDILLLMGFVNGPHLTYHL